MSNPYEVLGVSKDAGDDEIKKAFRKRSLELHPDRNTDKDTTDEFQNLNSAFDKIKTGELRQQNEMESQFGGMPGGMHQQQGGEFHDINHIFNNCNILYKNIKANKNINVYSNSHHFW